MSDKVKRVCFTLTAETRRQIRKLADLYNMPPTAVVAQAITKAFYGDPIATQNEAVANFLFAPPQTTQEDDEEEELNGEGNGAHHPEL